MQLRFVEDRRTLLWAFVLFPLVPALIFVRPTLALPLSPLVLYLSYCSGVLSHNHSHCPVFQRGSANRAYSAWLSLFYGCPIFVWLPTHHWDHHVHVNGAEDSTRTSRHSQHNTLFAALTYPVHSAASQLVAVRAYMAAEKRRSPQRFRRLLLQAGTVLGGHVGLCGVALAVHGAALGAFTYVMAFGLPAALAPWFMMFTNYLQHVDCDASSPGGHSRNFTHPVFNWLVFDNGYHTVHHDAPGLHWSRLRARHAAQLPRIDPRLNERTPVGYCLRQYLLPPAGVSPARAARRSSGAAL